MPTNEQRREAAKRKLQRQMERREQRARRQKQLTIAGSLLAVILLVGGAALVYFLTKGDDSTAEAASPARGQMPTARAKAFPETVDCKYDKSPEPAAKNVKLPHTSDIKTSADDVKVNMHTDQGDIGLSLSNAESPCTVNSFLSLASQSYFDNSPCHRLTTSGIKVLQCGDPTGTGQGGPGYQFANEFPTDQYGPNDQNAKVPVTYKRGTLAMANAGPGTNGSQFFLVYGDSPLPPQYTVFGTIDENGLKTLDKIAAAGIAGDGAQMGDGAPKVPVNIQSVKMA